MKKLLLWIFIFFSIAIKAQKNQYVKADNGLIVRKQANKESERIGKLDYGTEVYIIENSGIDLTIIDSGKEINGQWVKVEAIDNGIRGYVFSGYLTSDILSKRLLVKFEDFNLEIELNVWDNEKLLEKTQKDTVIIYASVGETPEGKKLKINQSHFENIEIYQRHENSITIMDEGPHCDLIDWKHHNSKWEKLNNNKSIFWTKKYESKEWKKFPEVSINDLKQYVNSHCGERWSKLLDNTNDINDFHIGVSISRIFLKIILTNHNDEIIKKLVVFEIPMGC